MARGELINAFNRIVRRNMNYNCKKKYYYIKELNFNFTFENVTSYWKRVHVYVCVCIKTIEEN